MISTAGKLTVRSLGDFVPSYELFQQKEYALAYRKGEHRNFPYYASVPGVSRLDKMSSYLC